MTILFLSRWFPYPADNGARIRIFNVIRQLAQRHEVVLLAFEQDPERVNPRALEALKKYCVSVRAVPYRPFRPTRAKAVAGLLSPQPRFLLDTHSQEMSSAVADEVGRRRCDLIVASQIDMAPYALGVRSVPAILEELELSTIKDAAHGERPLPQRMRSTLTWLKLRTYLRRVMPRFAACTVVSDLERANLRVVAPSFDRVSVLPNALDLSEYAGDFGPKQPNTVVFAGSLTYSANLDAARYFLQDVYPLITRAVPDVVFRITGSTAGVDLNGLPRHPGVEYTGHVADIRPVVAQSAVSVVPLRIGGGTRLKILESMALGTPVVSTSKGAEGLAAVDGNEISIADDPRTFASRVIQLLRSPDSCSKFAASGRRLVESRYDWSAVGRQLCAIVEQATARS